MPELQPQLEDGANVGRPPTEEAEKRLTEALTLYLQGTTSGRELAKQLGVSHQTGSVLIKKVRVYLGEAALDQEDFEQNKRLALLRAEDLLRCAWLNYSLSIELYERNKFLATILSILKHIAEISGVASGVSFQLRTHLLTQQDSAAMLRELSLTIEDFSDENYEKTVRRLIDDVKPK